MRESQATRWAALAAVCVVGALGCQSTHDGWQVAEDSEWREGGPRQAEPLPPPSTVSAHGLDTVYFDLDVWSLGENSRKALKANARAIVANPDWGRLTVEGHCDERGSEEYNLLLGKRRAAEVVGYLRDLGVPASRLRAESYGEARPAVQGYTEAAYRWNRRSVFATGDRTASR